MKGIIKIYEAGASVKDKVLSLLFFALGIAGAVGCYLYLKGIWAAEDDVLLKILVVSCPVAFVLAINFAVEYTIDINLKSGLYRNGRKLGPVNFGIWHHLPEIEYVSVFRQVYGGSDADGDATITHLYDVNLWHASPHCIALTQRYSRDEALEVGIMIAERMNVGLLDATIPNQNKWLREIPAKSL